jgi:hypothetical protein
MQLGITKQWVIMMLAIVQYHSNCCGMANMNILVKLMHLLWDNVEAFLQGWSQTFGWEGAKQKIN